MLRTRQENDDRSETDETPETVLADDAARTTRRHPLLWGLVLGIATVVTIVLVIAQNGESVRFEWLMFDADAPLWLLLLASAAVGTALLAAAAALGRTASHRATRRRAAVEQVRDRRLARVMSQRAEG